MPRASKAALVKKKRAAKKPSPKRRKRSADVDDARRIRMRIIGIGGGAGNIISEVSFAVPRVDFVAANTDTQALKSVARRVRSFGFGQGLTQGLGAGMDADLGEQAAREEKEKIARLLEGQDVCVLVASLGGGTGSGGISVFAEAAREAKCLSIGILTLPFAFEGEKRQQVARAALEKVTPLLNSYVVIPNDKIFEVIEKDTPLPQALSVVNKRLAESLEGLIETIYLPGLINVDFADLRAVLEGRGRLAYLNSSQVTGENKAQEASEEVLVNRLGEYGIQGADRILFNITADKSLKMNEVAHISKTIGSFNTRARIIFGISFRPDFKHKLRVTLFAVGAKEPGEEKEEKKKPAARKKPAPAAPKKTPKKKAAVPKKKNAVSTKKAEPTKAAVKKKKAAPAKKPTPAPKAAVTVRKNALDLKKEVDEELKSFEEEERKWDIPAFLRNKQEE